MDLQSMDVHGDCQGMEDKILLGRCKMRSFRFWEDFSHTVDGQNPAPVDR